MSKGHILCETRNTETAHTSQSNICISCVGTGAPWSHTPAQHYNYMYVLFLWVVVSITNYK